MLLSVIKLLASFILSSLLVCSILFWTTVSFTQLDKMLMQMHNILIISTFSWFVFCRLLYQSNIRHNVFVRNNKVKIIHLHAHAPQLLRESSSCKSVVFCHITVTIFQGCGSGSAIFLMEEQFNIIKQQQKIHGQWIIVIIGIFLNLGQLNFLILLSNIFVCFFKLQKTLHKVFFTKLLKLDPTGIKYSWIRIRICIE